MSDTIDQPANVLAPAPVGFNWMNLWTAAGGVAGAAAVVYCVGFGIEALRLNAAGLPVTEALAVIPKTALVSLAIDAIFLKVLIQGVLTALFMIWAKGRAAAMTAPEAVLRRGERANARKRRWQTVQASLAPLSRLFRSARRLLGRVTRALQIHRAARAALRLFLLILRGAVIVWRHTLSHVRHKFWITLGLLYAFLVPWTAFTLLRHRHRRLSGEGPVRRLPTSRCRDHVDTRRGGVARRDHCLQRRLDDADRRSNPARPLAARGRQCRRGAETDHR